MKVWSKLDTFYKGLFISTFYSFIFIIIGLILLIVDSSWIYGTLLGVITLYFSMMISWIIYFHINNKNKFGIAMSLLNWLLRLILFTIVFILFILVINPTLSNESISLNSTLRPVNLIMLLLVYSLVPALSYYTVPIVDSIIYKIIRK